MTRQTPVTDRWIRWRRSPEWSAVEHVLRNLERARAILVQPEKLDDCVGEICAFLDAERCLSNTRAARVRDVLATVGEDSLPGGSINMLALEACIILDRGAEESELRTWLEEYQRNPSVKWLNRNANADLAPLAGPTLRAYRGDAE